MKNAIKGIAGRAVAKVQQVWKDEPVAVITTVTSVVVFVCARVGVVVPEQTIAHAVAYLVPILLGGAAARKRVSPAVPELDEPVDAPGVPAG